MKVGCPLNINTFQPEFDISVKHIFWKITRGKGKLEYAKAPLCPMV